ncbi:hypothetical protein R1sor_006207 [Riccia sorocarpa]|uniref:Protein ENHANCED DISEASE RESISTANCE 2 C-terminal domain-containing protein n=1 Tax=Riccia sorocarpa TaxID=122646 RepID=A0ABD3HP13_9MARC
MGGCFSTHGKSKRRRARNAFTKGRKRTRGRANFVIPLSKSSLGAASGKYEVGDNAIKEFEDGGEVGAFLIERPVHSVQINGKDRRPQLDRQDSAAANSFGSRDEYFETDMSFNSDDEYMSVLGDFSSSNNSLNYPSNNSAPSQRPSVAELRAGILQAEKSRESSGKSGSQGYHAPEEGVVNGLAALTGTTPDIFRSDNASLDRSPRKSLPLSGEFKAISSLGRSLENSASGRNSSVPNTPTGRDSARLGSPGNGGDSSRTSTTHKSVFDGLCMPRFRPSMPTSRSRPVSPRYSKKKSTMVRFSFKRHTSLESYEDDIPQNASSKYVIDRPVAGTQIPRCSCERPVDGCWSEVAPSVFKLRGKHYTKDKKKHAAPNYALFLPIGVDLFISPRKLDHIAQYVKLPFQDSLPGPDSVPGVFIVNIQLPTYPPTIFLGDANGDGLSLVLYFKLSEESMQQAPHSLKEMLKKFVSDEVEKVKKGFIGESEQSFRDRLKFVARLVNPEDIHLSATEKKLILNYNEKPVLSRPQHCFYRGANYMEVDVDVHRFSYIARKGFDTFRERLSYCTIDLGMTIQASKQEELPEQVLGAVRLHKLDFGDCQIMEEDGNVHSQASDIN